MSCYNVARIGLVPGDKASQQAIKLQSLQMAIKFSQIFQNSLKIIIYKLILNCLNFLHKRLFFREQ